MSVRSVAGGFAALALACAGADLLACGDKFLVVGRGTRFERAPHSRQPADVLLYANPASPLPNALNRLSVEAALRKAGYRPTSVSSTDEFDQALRAGGWELVVVDLGDAPGARARLDGRDAPFVLPVALRPTRAALADAKKRYAGVISAPTRAQAFVDAVDDAIEVRRKAEAKSGATQYR